MAKDTTKTRTDGIPASASTSTGQLPATAAVPPVGPSANEGTPPADGAAMKVTTETATQPVLETVQTSTTPSGEPRSAEIEPQVPRSAAFRAAQTLARGGKLVASAVRSTYAGTLPARERVLASGERIAITAVAPDTETREFTATIRILKSKVLYEPGALVPLTRRDFEAKRSRSSVLERSFEDGLEASAD